MSWSDLGGEDCSCVHCIAKRGTWVGAVLLWIECLLNDNWGWWRSYKEEKHALRGGGA